MAKNFPAGVSYDIPYDTTKFIEVSIKEVVKTLMEAMVLVVVVYLFSELADTIIPTVAVPVSLIGTFAGLYAWGFRSTRSLCLGWLAIGIVVDDAIVVVENVERHMREDRVSAERGGQTGHERSHGAGDRHVLVLVSVFVPVGFIGGITGALYKQFAATIAISVTVSGFVALTLSPALCTPWCWCRGRKRGGFGNGSTGSLGEPNEAIRRRWPN